MVEQEDEIEVEIMNVDSLGRYYIPPKRFEFGAQECVAIVPQSSEGYAVLVYERRLPIRVFSLVATAMPPRTDAGRRIQITFGSGMEELAGNIAIAMSKGMMGVRDIDG